MSDTDRSCQAKIMTVMGVSIVSVAMNRVLLTLSEDLPPKATKTMYLLIFTFPPQALILTLASHVTLISRLTPLALSFLRHIRVND